MAIIATVMALGTVENCIFRDRVWRGRNSVPNLGTLPALIVRQAKLPSAHGGQLRQAVGAAAQIRRLLAAA